MAKEKAIVKLKVKGPADKVVKAVKKLAGNTVDSALDGLAKDKK